MPPRVLLSTLMCSCHALTGPRLACTSAEMQICRNCYKFKTYEINVRAPYLMSPPSWRLHLPSCIAINVTWTVWFSQLLDYRSDHNDMVSVARVYTLYQIHGSPDSPTVHLAARARARARTWTRHAFITSCMQNNQLYLDIANGIYGSRIVYK